MSHRDIDALKERMRKGRLEVTTKPKPKRKYRKLSTKAKAELCQRIVEADVSAKEAQITLDAIVWQAHKSGLSSSLIAQSLGVTAQGVPYRLKRIRKALGLTTTK